MRRTEPDALHGTVPREPIVRTGFPSESPPGFDTVGGVADATI